MFVGVDYYPEHWPEERWELDADMMKQAGFNVVRLAEFAWSILEPTEGVFSFEWLDKAITILHERGIQIILGTPTGSMPPWVAQKYPETVSVDKEGRKAPYGGRKDNCPSSTTYRHLGQSITRAMAMHYSNNPAVIGWQIDNEFGPPNCYCDKCLASWHHWLEKKFATVSNLNESWGTVFWSHIYNSFTEVPLPRLWGNNPSLELDYMRFHSDTVVSFQREQAEILRDICPNHFLTHNMMGLYDNVDYFDLSKDLDFVSHDYYYSMGKWEDRYKEYASGAAANDLMRSLKHKNYWIMETGSGPLGGRAYSRNLRPNEMRRMNYQAIAHGADGLVWFRWRSCRFGYEQYWHGLLGHDGEPNRRLDEASKIAQELKKIGDDISGTEVKSEAAIILSYEDRWALKIQPNCYDFKYDDHMLKYHKALSNQGLNVDFITLKNNDLDSYKLIIAPTLHVLSSETAQKLYDFVKNGGTLIVTFRSGVKDENNIPHALKLPGDLRRLAGVRVEDYEALQGHSYEVDTTSIFDNSGYTCSTLVDWIIPETAQTIAFFKEEWLKSYAAVTSNKYGKGTVYYIGSDFEQDDFYSKLIKLSTQAAGIESKLVPPNGVEIAYRKNKQHTLVFIMNHNDISVDFDIPFEGQELFSGNKVNEKVSITAGDVLIIKTKTLSY